MASQSHTACLASTSTRSPVCWGGGQNHGLASTKRPAHTCAISTLAALKTWTQDWRFHPSQIS
ncbi:unnamed protein product [Staurois parvus]|uniref:Uncharacterized protein n=1 Tax=Staurois parvus TaxID=386267 RepID=A0ABN9D1Y9_9NEOB|nr:unnamed protein product [Staurois parvus]